MKTYTDAQGQHWLFIPNFGRIAFDDVNSLREKLRGYGFQKPGNILRNVELIEGPQDLPGEDVEAEEPVPEEEEDNPAEEIVEEAEDIVEDILDDDGEE